MERKFEDADQITKGEMTLIRLKTGAYYWEIITRNYYVTM